MAKIKLLIIDDEKDFVETLSMRLEAKGYDIVKAFDGVEGLEMAHNQKPDMILLDIMMPGMNGFEVCRKLKVDEHFKDIPIIMLSAKYQPNDIDFATRLGADGYITKPVELNTLTDTIINFVKK